MAAPSEQFQDESHPTAIPLGPPAEDNGSQQASQEEEQQPLAPGEQLAPEEPPPYIPPRPLPRPTGTKFTVSGPIDEMAQAAQQMRPQVVRPYRPPIKEEPEIRQAARDYLDALMREPEAVDWSLRVHRTGPPLWNRNRGRGDESVPRGPLLSTPVVDYDSLFNEIVAYWGGGDYRVAVVNASGEYVPGKVSLNVKIPCDMHPPKFSKMEVQGEVREEPAFPATPTEESDYEQEVKRIKEKTRLANLRAQQEAAELEEENRQLTLMTKRREIARMRHELSAKEVDANPVDRVIDKLEQQRKDDREEARRQLEKLEQTAKADREAADKKFEQLLARISEKPKDDSVLIQSIKDTAAAAERNMQAFITTIVPLISKKDDGGASKDVFVALQNSNAQMMTGLATALAGRGDSGKEVRDIIASNQAQVTSLVGTMVTALGPKTGGEISEAQKLFFDTNKMIYEASAKAQARENGQDRTMMNTLLQAIMQPKQSEMTPETVLRLIGEGRKQMREGLEFAQSMSPPEPEPVSIPDADGYDAKAGVLGNLGKALYIGLKTAFQTASQHPEMLQPLLNYLGRRTAPTDEDLVMAAHGMEIGRAPQLPGGPQQVMIPMQRQYQMPAPMQPMGPGGPIITPVPPMGGRPAAVQPMGVQPVQPPQPVASLRPVGVQPAPTPPMANQPAQAAPPAPPPVTTATANQPPAAVQQAVASELEGDASGVAAPSEDEEEETPEDRLKYFVTASMKEALTNVTDRQNKHTWPLDAFEYWSGHFRDALAAEPVMDRRVEMIRNNCEEAVWGPLENALNTIDGGKQLVSFREAIEALVQMHRTQQNGGQPGAPA